VEIPKGDIMQDYLFKTKPFDHQLKVFTNSRDREGYALLMEQGTGKTKIIIDTVSWLYCKGDIDALLIVAPNGVQRNWVLNEIPIHTPDYISYKSTWYSNSPNKKEEAAICQVLDHQGLKIIAMNIESMATAKGVAFAKKFLLSFRSMLVIDESSTIKNPKATRTKNLLKLSVHAKYRRILTGTPVTQGPLDLFTQFSFLDSQILRCQSYYAFRNKYAIMKEMRTAGRSFMVVQGYVNTDELANLIAPHSHRVTKVDCLDLPDKLYTKRYVELSLTQRKLYNSLKKDVLVEFNGKEMSAPLALTKLLRLQQIVGGFFSADVEFDISDDGEILPSLSKRIPEAIDEKNPRVESLIELMEETNGKVIIWARFRAEIAEITKRLREDYGTDSCVEYHGGIENDLRSINVQRFQSDPEARFFVGHVQAGGKGLTLHAANTVVYFSNDFSLENRLQSEDRAHRIGQRSNVTYIDFVATNTLDETIVTTLRGKKSVADLITGDIPLSDWI
jgi:SNF2 family DNA or RNA helicase